MTIRVAAIEVSHWHALYDAAYLRHLGAMRDVELVAIQDSDSSPARCVCRRPASPALHALRHARPRAARCGAFWPAIAHLRPAQPAGTGALPNLGMRLDARSRGGRRRLPPQPWSARVRHVPSPDRRGGAGDWRPTEPARA